MNKVRGFTLIELMIAVVMVTILASLAQPHFHDAQKKSMRAAVQSELLNYAQDLQTYRIQKGSFVNTDFIGTANTTQFPSDKPLYTITLTTTNNTNTGFQGAGFTLKAAPIAGSMMAGDGVVCINHLNQRYWASGSTDCALSNTSIWLGD